MSSARDSNWSPQPPNLQELEKKEAAAMPVMFSRRLVVHSPGGRRRDLGGGESPGEPGGWLEEVSGPGVGERGRARRRHRAGGQPDRTAAGRSWEAGDGEGGAMRGRLVEDYVTMCLPVGV